MKISGNTVLITGGASGIGLELAKQLIDHGNKVIITGRDAQKLEAAAKQLPALHTIQSDVSDPAAIVSLFNNIAQDFPELNVLINNAGIMRAINLNDPISDVSKLTDITTEINTNLHGPIQMIAQFLPHLKTKDEAAIMNVSSGLAFVPLPTSPVYSATKAGLHSYTQSLRAQLKNTNVKVFELAPPLTETPLIDKMGREGMEGIKSMDVHSMVAIAIKGIEINKTEIRPGQSDQLKLMSRLAPNFIFKQLSKPVDGMLASSKS